MQGGAHESGHYLCAHYLCYLWTPRLKIIFFTQTPRGEKREEERKSRDISGAVSSRLLLFFQPNLPLASPRRCNCAPRGGLEMDFWRHEINCMQYDLINQYNKFIRTITWLPMSSVGCILMEVSTYCVLYRSSSRRWGRLLIHIILTAESIF